MDVTNKIYFATGLDVCDVPPEVITYFYEEWLVVFPDNECLVLHNTVVSIYEWLIKSSAKTDTGQFGLRTEKVGNVQVTVKGIVKSEDWSKALDEYLKEPTAAFPSCKGIIGVKKGRIIFGGTNKKDVKAIRSNSNSYSQYDEKSPYSPKNNTCQPVGFTCDSDDFSDQCDC